MKDDEANRRKKILYLSSKRGIKEADIIIGNFISKNIMSFSLKELEIIENLLAESDYDILTWLKQPKIAIPIQYKEIINKYHLS